MASFKSLLSTILLVFISTPNFSHYNCISFASASQPKPGIQFSTISAAPAVLPGSPLSSDHSLSPTLSPDITPLFPSPKREPLSPSESSLPTIPSSPSPPNPDAVIAPGPGIAFPPSGSLITSTAYSHASRPLSTAVLCMVLVASCVMWRSGM